MSSQLCSTTLRQNTIKDCVKRKRNIYYFTVRVVFNDHAFTMNPYITRTIRKVATCVLNSKFAEAKLFKPGRRGAFAHVHLNKLANLGYLTIIRKKVGRPKRGFTGRTVYIISEGLLG